jgi:HD-GYP domain-containing protein (c-di-GMP phosphodiesterase class II)
MTLALPVLHPRAGTVLLRSGFVLNDRMVRKLRELAVTECWVAYPSTDEICRFVSPRIQMRKGQVTGLIATMFETLHQDAHAKLEFTEYRRVLRALIEELAMDSTAAAYFTEMGGTCSNELRHASEVCFLSILLGMHLREYLVHERARLNAKHARDVLSLGIGAIVHDIGKMQLDEDIRVRCHVTADETDPAWQDHVAMGYRMLSGTVRPAAAGVILQHHQYHDGSGFPREMENPDGTKRGLKGREIHVFARIVNVANHFDRLRRRPDGSMMPRVRALRQMLKGPFTPRFDPVVLHALPQVAPAYPPGSLVRLSNGEHAVVVDWDPAHPCRPTVRPVHPDVLLRGETDQPGERIELREQRDLVIVEHDGFAVGAENFDLDDFASASTKDRRDAA